MASSQGTSSPLQFRQTPLRWLYALWKFWRPHTVIGTSLSVGGILMIALATPATPPPLGSGLGMVGVALWACLLGNLYIVGLNQLEDINIDRVNKPHLPLAAGEFSVVRGRWIVALAGLGALGLALVGGPWLLFTVGVSLALGTAYSLPPLRLKRFPFWASFCIVAVRGAVVNIGLFLYFSHHLAQPPIVPGRVWALTGFVVLFSVAIALFKDIPDIEGDRRYGIRTLSVHLGQRPVFNLARGILTVAYLGMVMAAPVLSGVHHPLLITTHLIALAALWIASLHVAPLYPHRPRATLSYPNFYQFIWKLFFLQYLMFPIACWFG